MASIRHPVSDPCRDNELLEDDRYFYDQSVWTSSNLCIDIDRPSF